MTSKLVPVVAIGAALVCTGSLAFGAAAPGPKARLFAKFDTNKNSIIDGGEVAAVRAAFAAEPKGDLARFDENGNGKLDDAEIAAMRPPGQKGAKSGKKDGGGKKNSETGAGAAKDKK